MIQNKTTPTRIAVSILVNLEYGGVCMISSKTYNMKEDEPSDKYGSSQYHQPVGFFICLFHCFVWLVRSESGNRTHVIGLMRPYRQPAAFSPCTLHFSYYHVTSKLQYRPKRLEQKSILGVLKETFTDSAPTGIIFKEGIHIGF